MLWGKYGWCLWNQCICNHMCQRATNPNTLALLKVRSTLRREMWLQLTRLALTPFLIIISLSLASVVLILRVLFCFIVTDQSFYLSRWFIEFLVWLLFTLILPKSVGWTLVLVAFAPVMSCLLLLWGLSCFGWLVPVWWFVFDWISTMIMFKDVLTGQSTYIKWWTGIRSSRSVYLSLLS